MRMRELLVAAVAMLVVVAASPAAIAWTPADARERFGLLVAESQKADDALNPLRLAERGLPPTGAVFVDPQSEAFARQLATNKRAELSGLAGIDRASSPRRTRLPMTRSATRPSRRSARSTAASMRSATWCR